MSQESHNDPERYYQDSLHRVPMTDVCREEMRNEREDSTDTDAIEKVFDYYDAEVGNDATQIRAREQLDALVERIAELEQQLSDEKGVCESLRSQNSDAVKEVQKLEKQIQQAERRGYELAVQAWLNERKKHVTFKSYEQAIAERDHIVDGNKMVCGEKK